MERVAQSTSAPESISTTFSATNASRSRALAALSDSDSAVSAPPFSTVWCVCLSNSENMVCLKTVPLNSSR